MSRLFFALLLAVAVAPLVSAEEALSVTTGTTRLELRPVASYERATLSLSIPDGTVLRRELEASASLAIDLNDLGGFRLLDGQYFWELVLSPRLSSEAKAQLRAARGSEREATIVAELVGRGELPSELMTYTGTFRVSGGTIAPANEETRRESRPPTGGNVGSREAGGAAGIATRDQVIADDLIVQFSACIGLDCVNGESFGFDTIRLKENSTRIKFEDTSVSAGFPTNDWQLTANDSASGGANKFSIEDITSATVPFSVTGGAPSNSIFVDSSGRVGLRTSTPVLDLHVVSSNSPSLRLEQNGSGGFGAHTWDIVGNEANFLVRDVTSGLLLPFRIRPGAPTSSLDISATGNIGIGTTSPTTSLDIPRTGAASEVQATTFSSDGALFSNMILRRALGTSSVPAAVTLNSVLGTFSFRGHNGTAFPTENNARLEVRAEENFTATANGTRMIFQTTQNGQATPTTRMVIKNDGSVGIGTLTPTAGSRLEVSGGSIRVTGGSFIDDGTTLNVPDYVFEPDYELRPLSELEAFITANKHLPGVPSRDDVKENGLNLSQFQMRLLEKVEELTLYTLNQQDHLQTLEAKNQELAAQNAALAARLEALEAAAKN